MNLDHVRLGLPTGTLIATAGYAMAYLAYYDSRDAAWVHVVEVDGAPPSNPVLWESLEASGSWVQDPFTWC